MICLRKLEVRTIVNIDRTRVLVDRLNYHRNLYYNVSRPEISDFEYDALFDELVKLEAETGFVLASSPTQTVGYEVKSNLTKVKHNHPMLSLDKTKSVDDIIKFLDGKDGVIMAKMDGLTCSLRYIDGELVSAETRGDGETGEDILHCAKTIKNIPLHINIKEEIIVDGEVIITYNDFEKINATLPENEKYKHPRNLASGSIRQLDSNVAAERNMKFIAWKLIKGCEDNSFIERLRFMENIGFEITPYYAILNTRVNERMNNIIELIKKESAIKSFPIDGCVFGYDDVAYGDSLGATGHHLRSQIAFKFYDELYETKLLGIDWTMGKTGTLTPTAVFEPIDIDGTNIERASMHNLSIMADISNKQAYYKGMKMFIYKANQIIPQVDHAVNIFDEEIKSEVFKTPTTCPICGGKTAIKKDVVSEVLVCTNDDCSGKMLGKLNHFVSRKAMDIQGMSEATLETLISNGFIHNYNDIYHLKEHQAKLIHLDGMGKKSVLNMLKSIEDSRNVKLENFICALGIPNIGSSASKTISKACNSDWNTLFDMWNHGYDFTQLDDFGEVTADNFVKYFDANINDILILVDEMNFQQKAQVSSEKTSKKVQDLNFCITGSLVHYANRDALVADIEANGGKFVSGVSKKCNYLINNDVASNSSKNKKAKECGVPIITEEEFMEMIK